MGCFINRTEALHEMFRQAASKVAEYPVVFLDPKAFRNGKEIKEAFLRSMQDLQEGETMNGETAALPDENHNHHDDAPHTEEIYLAMDHVLDSGLVDDIDIETMRNMLNSQHPGLSEKLDDKTLKQQVIASVVMGPHMRLYYDLENDDGPICLINGMKDEETGKQLFLNFIKRIDDSYNLPGGDLAWSLITGVHEGRHCRTDSSVSLESARATTVLELYAAKLKEEIAADWHVYKVLQKLGWEDVAQGLIDVRTLRAEKDPGHATGYFLSRGIEAPSLKELAQHITATQSFRGILFDAVAEKLSISPFKAEDLLRDDPEQFIETAQALLDDGTIRARAEKEGNPLIADYIEMYVGARKRQAAAIGSEKNTPDPSEAFDEEVSTRDLGCGLQEIARGGVTAPGPA